MHASSASCDDVAARSGELRETVRHRSPTDAVLSPNGEFLVTTNESSNSISLIRVDEGLVVAEAACGERPAEAAFCLGGTHVAVTCSYAGVLQVFSLDKQRLQRVHTIAVGDQPVGVAVAPAGKLAYVGLVGSAEVAEVDLEKGRLVRRMAVGHWPRHLTVSPNGERIVVGCSGEGKIAVLDARSGEVLYEERLAGAINIGHMQCSSDGTHVYFPWMVYRNNPITQGNIQLGWVLASRVGRVRLDGPDGRESISLDVPRKAVADPHGLAINGSGQRLAVAASGTHELLVYRLPDLPFVRVSGDLIDRRLMQDRERFDRVDLGGRPMGLSIADDERTAFVANYTRDCVQVVDLESRKLVTEIALGPTPEKTPARLGMELFYDGKRSLDQWYSCHSCHYNGGSNARPMDTFNDGSELTNKTVLPLYDVHKTAPWTWHGWQTSLRDAMHKSFTITMLGPPIEDEQADAVTAFLATLTRPPSPQPQDSTAQQAVARGKKVFESASAACMECHNGPLYSDGEIHDVGLGRKSDRYDGYNTPSLLGVSRKVRFLHDGRAKSLEDVLTGPHAPDKVSGERPLTENEVRDLLRFLHTL